MKKIISTAFVFIFALLFVSHNAMASSVWNGASNDCQGLSVANHTTNTGIIVPCWPLTTVSANGGDVINIRVYYHNTSGLPATNVKVSLDAPSGAASSHTFSGQITSDQGSINLGSVRVNTPSGTTLTFSGAHWLPNQKQTESSLLYGQRGSEILGGGLAIGTIASSWEAQGSVVIAFSVVGQVNPPTTMTGEINASNPSCVIATGSSTCSIPFTWSTKNPVGTSAVTHDGSTVATGNSGSQSFSISNGSQSFFLYNNSLKLDTATVSASCASGSSWNGSYCNPAVVNGCSINNFSANPTSITSGGSSTLNWSTSNCTSVTISNLGYSVPTSGSQIIYPASTKTYVLNAYGNNGSDSRSVTVSVNEINNTCSITNFKASDTSINDGDSTTISWNTTDCNSVSISSIGTVAKSGSYRAYPTSTKTYTITAIGSYGSDTDTLTVYVDDNNDDECRITSFDSDDTSINDGDSAKLEWETENCDRVSISGVASNLDENDSYRVYPTSTRTYTLNAYGDNGSDSESIKIYVDEDNNDDNTCYVNSFTASNTYVTTGGNTKLNWDTENCNNVVISYLGSVRTSGSQTIYPVNNTNYVLTAYGPNGGVQTRSVYVTLTPYVAPVQPVIPVNNCAVTTVATNISQSGAQLNGIISGSAGANTYFEYGTSVNLGSRTTTRYSNTGSNFSDFVSNLSTNTIYYYRMVSDCQGGLSQGSIEVFRTLATTVVKQPVIIQGTTVVGAASPVILNISNRYQLISEGDLVDYVVTYKNISKTKLTHPMVQVILPTNITLVNASRGTYSIDTHTLSAQIEDLNAGQEGVIYLQGRVDSIPLNNSQIPTTAILVYTGTNGAQENAMAYVINTPKVMAVIDNTGSVLGGSAFFGGIFSMGLVGWLLIILLILIIILIARSFSRSSNGTGTHTPTH